MKILFFSKCFPWPLEDGGRLRRYHLLEALTRRHEVTLVALTKEDRTAKGYEPFPLRDRCARVVEMDAASYLPRSAPPKRALARVGRRICELFSSLLPSYVRRWNVRELVDRFREIRQSDRFDLVWMDLTYFAEVARRAGFDRLLVDLEEIVSDYFGRALKYSPWYRLKPFDYIELAKLRRYERSLPGRFWRLLVCSERERGLLGRQPENVFVVPNGVAEFPLAPPEKEHPGEVLFVGQMDYEPNMDAACFFGGSIFPRVRQLHAAASFHVVGRNPGPPVLALQDGPACVVHGRVPDVTPYFERASVVVAPLRQGGGTRLKVLEALGRGKALVATSTAAEGLDLRPGVDLEVVDEPEAFARACARLLGDPAARQKLGAAGRQRVFERYRWDAVTKLAEQVVALSPEARAAGGLCPEPGASEQHHNCLRT